MTALSTLSIAELSKMFRRGTLDTGDLVELRADPRLGARKLAEKAWRKAALESAEQDRLRAMTAIERGLWNEGVHYVAGVDEVGAGPLAGPVVAAAVVLPKETLITHVNDSKKLSLKRRTLLESEIKEKAVTYSFGICSPAEVDELNIYQASREAMRRAVAGLQVQPNYILVDARVVPGIRVAQQAITGGDGKSQSIAAASIIAKVHRDDLMRTYSEEYPGYGFERHSGYPTKAHVDALRRLGPTPIHRRSFGPVKECLP